MARLVPIGAVLTLLGLVGYGLGLTVAYPGRALSVTAVMLGITLLAMGRTAGEVGA